MKVSFESSALGRDSTDLPQPDLALLLRMTCVNQVAPVQTDELQHFESAP
jgi:hypothetical protein